MRSATEGNGVPEYDLIICGGGIAGLGLARQLALRGDDISVLVLDMSEEGRYEHLAALGCVLLVILALLVWAGFKIAGRDFMLRRDAT